MVYGSLLMAFPAGTRILCVTSIIKLKFHRFLKVFGGVAIFSPHLRYPAEIAGTKNAVHFLCHDIKYLGHFLCCAMSPFVIEYKYNLLISITKGATERVYLTQYPYPTSERILRHSDNGAAGSSMPYWHSSSLLPVRSLQTSFAL
jgi:hypothetical protein